MVEEAGQAMTESYFEVPAPQGARIGQLVSVTLSNAPVRRSRARGNRERACYTCWHDRFNAYHAHRAANREHGARGGSRRLPAPHNRRGVRCAYYGTRRFGLLWRSVKVQSLMALFSELFKFVEGGGTPDQGFIQRALDLLRTAEFTPSMLREDILLTYRGRAIRPKTAGQKHYVDAIRKNTITFGIGPAGTGKTYLAMAMAVAALKRKEVGRIISPVPLSRRGRTWVFSPAP